MRSVARYPFHLLLPFDDRTALVGSTMFAPSVSLMLFPGCNHPVSCGTLWSCQIYHRTNGGWRDTAGAPAALLICHDRTWEQWWGHQTLKRLCLAFIQKQIADTIARAGQTATTTERGSPLALRSPHKSVDLWMDRFLSLSCHWPARAPACFCDGKGS